MKKIISLQMLDEPLSLPWMYPDYTPVPEDRIKFLITTLFAEEPRIFFLSEQVVKQTNEKFNEPDPDDPECGSWVNPYENESTLFLNMPFTSVLIESRDALIQCSTNCPLLPNDWSTEKSLARGMIDHRFFALAIRELAPLKYVGLGIFLGQLEDKADFETFEKLRYNGAKFLFKDNCFFAVMAFDDDAPFDKDADSTFFHQDCFLFARAVFDEMKTKYAIGKEKSSQRIRVGSGVDRRLMRIKNILHVAMKKEQSSYAKALGKEIEWTHRWEVMGHWRKVNTIGKDRNGTYGIQGFTWVVPHTKGPNDKDLIKKIRVVKP